MTLDCMYSTPYSEGKLYRGKSRRIINIRVEVYRTGVRRVNESARAEHVWEKGDHIPCRIKLK